MSTYIRIIFHILFIIFVRNLHVLQINRSARRKGKVLSLRLNSDTQKDIINRMENVIYKCSG